ncbi:hypothetical protein CAPTEDRAFT_214041 [Capitella teleta]|uniref:Uncharacterized protein n=1 Tax=Capitella teleta TaxID=283909 RepID=R7TK20_CAPTE|nr:hypothetical protein CAPTEDRAFT_214041 [Capitella teleta]|eukprot:ELT94069.1 hypothetical protein CAPTEDRAFT_214041 [Capitella teleta]
MVVGILTCAPQSVRALDGKHCMGEQKSPIEVSGFRRFDGKLIDLLKLTTMGCDYDLLFVRGVNVLSMSCWELVCEISDCEQDLPLMFHGKRDAMSEDAGYGTRTTELQRETRWKGGEITRRQPEWKAQTTGIQMRRKGRGKKEEAEEDEGAGLEAHLGRCQSRVNLCLIYIGISQSPLDGFCRHHDQIRHCIIAHLHNSNTLEGFVNTSGILKKGGVSCSERC